MESKKRYNKKFFLMIAVSAAISQFIYFSPPDHTAKSATGLHAGSFQSASFIKIKPAAFIRDMIADSVSTPIDLDNCSQVQTELPGDTSGETEGDLAEAVKTQQAQLELLKKENERLGEKIDVLSNCLDVQRKNNISLEKRIEDIEELKAKLLKAKFAKKILGL